MAAGTTDARLKDQLRLAEEKFAKAFRMSPAPLILSEMATGLIRDINLSFTQTFGYTEAQSIGRTTMEIGLWASAAERDQTVALMREQGQLLNHEVRLLTRDGETLTVVGSSARIDIEESPYWLIQFRDITAQKMIELEMERKTTLLQATLENMAQGISVVDRDLRITAFNRKFCELLEFPLELVYEGASFESLIRYNAGRGEYGVGDIEAIVREAMRRVATMEAHRFTRARPNGRVLEVVGHPFPGGGFVTTYSDITDQVHAEMALRQSESRFRLMFERTADALLLLDPVQAMFIECNQAAADMLRLDDFKASLPLHPADLSPLHQPDGRLSLDKAGEYIAIAMHNGSHRFEWIHCSPQRPPFPVEVLLTPILMGETHLIVTTWRDITDRKRIEAKLELAASVFSHAREGIMITDAGGNIVEVNHTFTLITGYARDEVIGRNPRLLKSGRHSAEQYGAMWKALASKDHWYGEVWNRRKNGEVYAEMLTISAVRDAAGKTQNYVALFSDITPLKEHQQQLERIAHYDALTSLPNRVLLADRLKQAIAQTQRRAKTLSVVYIDLDGFKEVNDQHGHDVGDQLLIALAQRMKEALREGDTLARIGGDEFVAVLVDLEAARDCEPVLERLLEAAAAPVPVGEDVLRVSASIGVSSYGGSGDDPDQLLRQADQAMYQAKQTGKNRYHYFDFAQDTAVKTRHESLEHVRRAFAQRQFVLYYQPIVDMRSGEVTGVEALIRWQHPERGLLLPEVFLPIIEDRPISVELGEWVIAGALAQMSAWRAAGLDLPVSVNIGARQLQRGDFIQRLRDLLAAHAHIPPSWLSLEILETNALEDIAEVSDIIRRCGEIGVSYALDDFGTGYSSLTYLKRLPAEVLKIDRSFVHDMLDDPEDLAIVEGVIGLARAFHRTVIAEGVESVAHGELLLQLGCHLAQGYGIAPPMPAADIPQWVASWRPASVWTAWGGLSENDRDHAVLLAEVAHRHWLRGMEVYLRGGREKPPPQEAQECRFGRWLDGIGRSRFGAHAGFSRMVTSHDHVHVLGRELVRLYEQGQAHSALERLDELHALRDELLSRLRALLT